MYCNNKILEKGSGQILYHSVHYMFMVYGPQET